MTHLKIWTRLLLLLLGLWHSSVYAHKPSDSYLTVNVGNATLQNKSPSIDAPTITAQWDIALRDLDYAIGLDEDANGEINWQEVLSKQETIFAYSLARLNISSKQQNCALRPDQLLIDNHTDGAYAVIQLTIDCKKTADQFSINYSLFSNLDPSHRGLLKLNYAITDSNKLINKLSKTAIFGPDNPSQTFNLTSSNRLNEFKEYVVEGIWHIWIGYDHILFLISLLLPAVLVYSAKSWQPSQHFKATFVDVLKVVTAFTIAHSITLTLATLQIIELPSRWVEAAIAASVILAALNNLFPYLLKRRWLAAFVFGLIHGFGFAAVLADLGLQQGTLIVALVGFNVGVEIGQVGILSVFVPLAYIMRQSRFYKYVIFYGGSTVIALIASAWFVERVFNLTLFSSVANLFS